MQLSSELKQTLESIDEPIVALTAVVNDEAAVIVRALPQHLTRIGGRRSVRFQYVRGFYPAGAIISIRVNLGALVVEANLNPADPRDRAFLDRLSKQAVFIVHLLTQADQYAFSKRVLHQPLVRRELIYLLELADNHLKGCPALSWSNTLARFCADKRGETGRNESGPSWS